ncbi:MAG: hypothetical protein NC182_02745 [Prevotella sp.]|nr:hypothetical protein [Staphylococcus sp.]MCM1350102.1 hypothetical protein [Prevotella sp.]
MIFNEQKYNEIIGVRPNFDDTFNLIQEKPDAWKSFITNSQFENNLKKIFHAFSAGESNLNDRKSIWIQGTYGTGKSHSTAVIKHLLSDECFEIEEFKKSLADVQLRSMIDDFRKIHKAFPVVLRGAYTIGNVTDMSYEIQKQTRNALSKEGIFFSINTDFEKAISLLDDPYMESFWKLLLDDDLKIYCKTKDDIRNSLKNYDKEILGIIENRYRKINDGGFGTSSITKWLKDVQHELAKHGIADHLLIIWDEFTSLLSSPESRSILNTAQDIAELAKEYDENGILENIYLIVVTHKNIEATDAYRAKDMEEQKLALARFITCSYEMQPNTTYHILSSTLNRINEPFLNDLIKERILSDSSVSSVIDRIAEHTQGNISEIKHKIISLYPFHPYTAYLSTFVSRQLGDAERSVFNFLNDEEVGFKKFLKNKIHDKKFMSASYIWDFFLKINNVTYSSGKLSEVINKYNLHYDSVKKKGNEYLDVFKVVLLLNALNAVVNSGEDSNERSLVTPNITNVRDCYSGIKSESNVLEILEYFDKNNIIMKSADGIYEVSTASISPEKLLEITKIKVELYNEITKTKDYFPLNYKSLENAIMFNNGKTVRKTEILYLSSILKNNQIEIQLKTQFKNPFSIKVCVFMSHGPSELTKGLPQERNNHDLEQFIRNLSSQEEYKNIIFMNLETNFTELWFSRFIDAVAKMDIHQNIKPDEFNAESKKASGWITKWFNTILNDGQVFLAFQGNTNLMNFRSACNKISEEYIKFIYPCGLDTLKTAKKAPIWEEKTAKAIVQNILFNPKRDDIESKLKGGIQVNIQALFKDEKNNYIFDNDLNLNDFADENHPIVVLCNKVKELLSPKHQETLIDLHQKLKPLFDAPYGLYANPISYAAISIALRPYVDKLFVANNGTKVDKTVMVDIVEYLFKAINGGKPHSYLTLRYSSVEEVELINELNDVFDLKESGLMNIRWAARDQFDKKAKAPIWALKYLNDPKPQICLTIDDLFRFTIAPDESITQSEINSLLNKIQNYRLELKTYIYQSANCNLLEKFIEITLTKEKYVFSSNDLNYYIKYLEAHMNDGRPYWQESQITNKILRAYFEKMKPEPQQNDIKDNKPNGNNNSHTSYGGKSIDIISKNTVLSAKKKINDFNGSIEQLKQLFIDLIDTNNKVANFIDEKIK